MPDPFVIGSFLEPDGSPIMAIPLHPTCWSDDESIIQLTDKGWFLTTQEALTLDGEDHFLNVCEFPQETVDNIRILVAASAADMRGRRAKALNG